MRVGTNAWSMQHHIEVKADTVDNWAQIPAYRDALIEVMRESGLDGMRREAAQHMSGFLETSETLYANFMCLTRT